MTRPLIVFALLAYGLAWAAWLPLVLRGEVVIAGDLPTHMHGLLAPAVAAFVAAALEGRAALRDLAARVLRVRMPTLAWTLALSPFAALVLGLAVEAATSSDGLAGALAGLGRYSGVPELGLAAVVSIVFVANCLGEEIGWRGFALPRLQAWLGPLGGTLALFPLWALWHLPLFWVVATFMQMGVLMIPLGWALGLLAGTFVLAHVTHVAAGAVLAPALWHLGYNMASATELGFVAPAAATTVVMVWAIWLLRTARGGAGPSRLAVPPPP